MSRRVRSLAYAIVVVAAGHSSIALATQLRRPFDASIGLSYGHDHNGAAAGCEDYACADKCFDGHKGNDFTLPLGTAVLAAAAGTVNAVNDACPDVGFLGSQCGAGYGNYVRLEHSDGTWTYYGHLKSGSLTVALGQSVACGEKIAESASSGNSTGNHLHFEKRVRGVPEDSYAGQCAGPLSAWVDQGPYDGTPAATCEVACSCNPGEMDVQECGDCGTQMRTCQGDCQWGELSSCDGPDPEGGNQVCQPEAGDPCVEGRMRCAEGVLVCEPEMPSTGTSTLCPDVDFRIAIRTPAAQPADGGDGGGGSGSPKNEVSRATDSTCSHAELPRSTGAADPWLVALLVAAAARARRRPVL